MKSEKKTSYLGLSILTSDCGGFLKPIGYRADVAKFPSLNNGSIC